MLRGQIVVQDEHDRKSNDKMRNALFSRSIPFCSTACADPFQANSLLVQVASDTGCFRVVLSRSFSSTRPRALETNEIIAIWKRTRTDQANLDCHAS
mmetsp:Transcript_11493/g.23369  ORF Transcript_11493/g.23369 Transcript_11493/m.23369 type:complete len:97 (+) Transcript_11493:65-355(+)